jgi:hypothetical protein
MGASGDQEPVVREGGCPSVSVKPDNLLTGIDGYGPVPLQNINTIESGAMRQVVPIWRLSTNEERQATNAEVGEVIGERDGHVNIRLKFVRPQGCADAGVAPADDKKSHTVSESALLLRVCGLQLSNAFRTTDHQHRTVRPGSNASCNAPEKKPCDTTAAPVADDDQIRTPSPRFFYDD